MSDVNVQAATRIVVDASVAAKWLLPEVYTAEAQVLLGGGYELLAPDLLFPEVGNILWKRVRSGELSPDKSAELMAWLGKLPLSVHGAQSLTVSALEIAGGTGRTVYDSLYLALAVQEDATLITADEKLANGLAGSALARSVILLQEAVDL